MSNVLSTVVLTGDTVNKYFKYNIHVNYSESQLVGGWSVDYLHNRVKELNSGLSRRKPDNSTVEDLWQWVTSAVTKPLGHVPSTINTLWTGYLVPCWGRGEEKAGRKGEIGKGRRKKEETQSASNPLSHFTVPSPLFQEWPDSSWLFLSARACSEA